MNAQYSGDQHGVIIKINMDQISNYFDIVERDGGEKHDEHVVCSLQLHGMEKQNL
jgi:hypothetical protein